jgi:hypothetical protein
MGCERLAHTVLRRDTLLKTSEHRWQSTEFPCPARDTGCAILERRGWSPTLGFGPTVTSHDRCLATRPSGQGTQEGARPGTSAARAAPHRLLDRQMLHSESDCIYEVSRTEPFRLRHVRASDAPVTPALINRTVRTILGIMEPGQPPPRARVLPASANSHAGRTDPTAHQSTTTASSEWRLCSIWGRTTTGSTCIAAPMTLVMLHRPRRRSPRFCSGNARRLGLESATCSLRIPGWGEWPQLRSGGKNPTAGSL